MEDSTGDGDSAAKGMDSDNLPRQNFIPAQCRSNPEAAERPKGYDKSRFQPVKRSLLSGIPSSSGIKVQRVSQKPQQLHPKPRFSLDYHPQVDRSSPIKPGFNSVDVPGRMKTKPHPLKAPISQEWKASSPSSSKPSSAEPASEAPVTPDPTAASLHYSRTLEHFRTIPSGRSSSSESVKRPQLLSLANGFPQRKPTTSAPRFSLDDPVRRKLLMRKQPKEDRNQETTSSPPSPPRRKSLVLRPNPIGELTSSPTLQNAPTVSPQEPVIEIAPPMPTSSTLPDNAPRPSEPAPKENVPNTIKRRRTSNGTGSQPAKRPPGNGLNDSALAAFFDKPSEPVQKKPSPSKSSRSNSDWPKNQSKSAGSVTKEASSNSTQPVHRPPPLMSIRFQGQDVPPPLMNYGNPIASPCQPPVRDQRTFFPDPVSQPPIGISFFNNFIANQMRQSQMPRRELEARGHRYPAPAQQLFPSSRPGFNGSFGQHQVPYGQHQVPQQPGPRNLHNSMPIAGIHHNGPSTSGGPFPLCPELNALAALTSGNRQMEHPDQSRDQNRPPAFDSGSGRTKTREEVMAIFGKCMKLGYISKAPVPEPSTPVTSDPAVEVKEEVPSENNSRATSPAVTQHCHHVPTQSTEPLPPLQVDVSTSSGFNPSLVKEEPMSPQEHIPEPMSVQEHIAEPMSPEEHIAEAELESPSSPDRPPAARTPPGTPPPEEDQVSPQEHIAEPMSPEEHISEAVLESPSSPDRPPAARTPPGTPPPEEHRETYSQASGSYEFNWEQYSLLMEIGGFTLQGFTGSNGSSQDYRKRSTAEYYVATDPSKDDLVRKVAKWTTVVMRSSVTWWNPPHRTLTVWCVTEPGKRPLLWFYRPAGCFTIQDVPPFTVPVYFVVVPVPLNAWFYGYKSETRPYPYGKPRREPSFPGYTFVEKNAGGEDVHVVRWQCNGCQSFKSRGDFNLDDVSRNQDNICSNCSSMCNDSFWVPAEDAPLGLVDYHYENPCNPNWSSDDVPVKVNTNYVPVQAEKGGYPCAEADLIPSTCPTPVHFYDNEEIEEPVAKNSMESRLVHADSLETADSGVAMEDRSRPSTSESPAARLAVRRPITPVKRTDSAEYHALAASLADDIEEFDKLRCTSHVELTDSLFDHLRDMHEKTMKFMDRKFQLYNLREYRETDLSSDIENWTITEFLNYISDPVRDFTRKRFFMATMQIPCFSDVIGQTFEILKKKSQQITKREQERKDREQAEMNRKRKATYYEYRGKEYETVKRLSDCEMHPRTDF